MKNKIFICLVSFLISFSIARAEGVNLASGLPLLSDPVSGDKILISDVSENPDKIKHILYSDLFKNVGNMTFAASSLVRSGSVAGNELNFGVYENDTAAERTLLQFVSGNSPYLLIAGSANASVNIYSSTLGVVAAPVVVTASSITLTNGSALKTGTEVSDTLYLQTYDTDGAAMKNMLTCAAGTTAQCAIIPPADALFTVDRTPIGLAVPSTGSFTTLTTSSTVSHKAGTGSSTYAPAGTIQRDLVDVGNIGTGEDTLITETVAANSLPTGRCLVFKGNGATAANANTKAIRFTYSGVELLTVPTTAFPAASVYRWGFTIKLCGTATNVQEYDTNFEVSGGAAVVSDGNTTIDTSIASNATILATGTADNDIVAKALHIGIE